MTPPVTTEALDYVRDLIRQSLKVGAPGVAEPAREAIVRSIFLKIDGKVIQPLLSDKAAAEAALQQVTAERDEDRAELARLRAEGEAKDRALKPFAKCADVFWGRDDVGVCFRQATSGMTYLEPLTIGDFRAARAATAREG